MTGLEDRLRSVNGVSDIVVELSDDGLEGIRVRMHEGTDESQILEEIRRILVAYGLKGSTRKKPGTSNSAVPPLELGDDDISEATAPETQSSPPEEQLVVGGEVPEPVIIPAGDQLTVRLHDGSRTVEATSDATPLGAADAMVRAVCDWKGTSYPSRVAVDRLDIDGMDLVIIVARSGTSSAVAAAPIQSGLAVALKDAASHIVEQFQRF